MEFKNMWYLLLGGFVMVSYLLRHFQLGKKPEFYFYKKETSALDLTRHLKGILGLVGLALISFALSQPRVPLGHAKNTIKVNDIFIVVDVSRSMLAEDFRPNRLVAAREKIREFVKLRPTDRIGIVMFSEKAFTLLPLSTDLDLIEKVIGEINTGFLGSGTNIGDALGLAVGRATQSLAENKVIILLTDGVSNVGNMTPLQAAQQAKEQNLKVYTIGIGQKANAALLRTSGRNYQRIPGGSVDLETLEKISTITGGKSFYAGSEGALEEVLNEIQKLEKTEIQSSSKVIYKELYWPYLIWGIIAFLLAELFGKTILREVL